ncbi:SDR family NAD(P)-dependent oxidoreductase [Lyngbya sp. PCC 8106]|uniref:SDR family NAD(P)-dependent oxidoreductase n=1 Tax=Lyngbya sp. (strain PCC 8106) TaxID=313612 RepID=UPI0000EABCB8|nr:SDR family oxidoreductase [Lyngbya sp. PCC 8106]EAW35606.1 short-chain alcohol dehydrogenase family protein [Lyngbya sp. PCC 8106]
MKQVVLITGVLGGIGSATAELFHNNGWSVVGVDCGEVSDQVGGVDFYIRADVSDPLAWESIANQLSGRIENLNAIVNNAAIQVCKPLVETTPEEWDRVMAVNVRSVYLAVRQLYPFMQQQGGAIVNVSSVHAIATSANIAAYAASKGAMLALTRALAIELAGDQIRVNAVLPGAVETPMLYAGLSRGHLQGEGVAELVEQLGSKHVIGRVGQPGEIAEAIYFLADGGRSGFMTGQSLVVDGGATARLSTE